MPRTTARPTSSKSLRLKWWLPAAACLAHNDASSVTLYGKPSLEAATRPTPSSFALTSAREVPAASSKGECAAILATSGSPSAPFAMAKTPRRREWLWMSTKARGSPVFTSSCISALNPRVSGAQSSWWCLLRSMPSKFVRVRPDATPSGLSIGTSTQRNPCKQRSASSPPPQRNSSAPCMTHEACVSPGWARATNQACCGAAGSPSFTAVSSRPPQVGGSDLRRSSGQQRAKSDRWSVYVYGGACDKNTSSSSCGKRMSKEMQCRRPKS
mmetsp:Transcript_60505/g.153773  ORF Transcript_60505/g.153773 Transcript_60505/m.153773 type:complete len:270 (-) Transcript_60505:163-972(-)